MNLHESVVERLVKIFENFGGHREQIKLKEELRILQLSVYQRQTGNQDEIIVLTNDLDMKSRSTR